MLFESYNIPKFDSLYVKVALWNLPLLEINYVFLCSPIAIRIFVSFLPLI